MAETKRYNVGAKHGYRTDTILKLTAEQAKQMGLGPDDVSDLTTTADSVTKRDRYDEAMTSQDRMRDAELRRNEPDATEPALADVVVDERVEPIGQVPVEEAIVDAPAGEGDETPEPAPAPGEDDQAGEKKAGDVGDKKRPTPATKK